MKKFSFGRKRTVPSLSSRRIRPRLEALEDRCLLDVNPIVAENRLPGAPQSQWDIVGAGDPSIQGYATDISVNHGDTVYFKINTPSTHYRLDIYRMGYYGGMGARLVDTVDISLSSPQVQPGPITDPATGLQDFGTWKVSASWAVPATAVSGIYFAKLVREDGVSGSSHVFFVVRDDGGIADVLYQTSDATWEAYNQYGGNSLYTGNGSVGRAYKVSYNRPFDDRSRPDGFGSENWVFDAEYPMVRWLEANGYYVSYFTDVDSDRRGSEILNHKVFLSSGHDEYWSGDQRINVEAARDSGVNLAFFSGNEVFWKTRWETSIDGSGTPYRTLVCYKESTANDKIDPLKDTWTGNWRDPRFSPRADGGRPENGLTGTIFEVNGEDSRPIQVPSDYAGLRFWRNTSVAALAPGQTATLADGTLGYEWDVDLDNGARPAGLFDMSSTTAGGRSLLWKYGNTYVGGTATHSLTMYRAASGALVFGAGTVRWSWGLDANHDNGVHTTDPRMQQATINLFADMGVQPGSIQPGMVAATASTDHAAPTSTFLGLSATTVPNGKPFKITGTATDTGGGVVAGVEVSTDGGATWHPADGLSNWSYTWTPNGTGPTTILSRAVDDSGNLENPGSGITVNLTGPMFLWDNQQIPALVADTDPKSIEVGMKFRSDVGGTVSGIRFYKGPNNTGTHVGSLWSNSGSLLASVTFTGETTSGWQEADFSTPVTINANTTYVISYHTSAGNYSDDQGFFTQRVSNGPLHALADGEDGPNGVYGYSTSSTFPTLSTKSYNYWVDVVFTPSGILPTVTARTPVPGATGIAANATVKATFNESVLGSSITFSLQDAHGIVVPASVGYDDTTRTVTLTPSAPLASSTPYIATISGARDASGNVMAGSVSWTFTTIASTTIASSIWPSTTTPVVASDPDKSALELGLKFRSTVAGQIAGVRFYKGSTNTGTHMGNLWSSSGTLLASATFTGETASGWQQVLFSTPVAINANTTYVVSYHTNVGHYAADNNYFATAGVVNGSLRALANGVDGPNGVYAYGFTSNFPTQNAGGTNYWVDVLFQSASGIVPTVTSQTPAPGATNVATTTTVQAVFNESIVASSIVLVLKNAAGTAVSGSVTYDDATRTATLTPAAALAPSTTYTATVSGAKDASGNVLAAPVSWSFTTEAAPAVTSQTPATGATNVVTSTNVKVVFNKAIVPSTLVFGLKDSVGTVIPATVSYDATTNTATLTPSGPLANSTTYVATVSQAKDASGNSLAVPVSWSFTTAAPISTTPSSIWPSTAVPGNPADPDTSAVELGLKFRSDVAGQISGIRFYKGSTNTGTHMGNFWSSSGTLLASATFTGETASGWQQVLFSTPVAINANTTYVVSYHTNVGHYSDDDNYFATAGVDNGPLHALKNGVDGANGVYAYGASSNFPNQPSAATNYWVDVVFQAASVVVPTVTGQTPAPGATNVTTKTLVQATFNESIVASSIVLVLKNAAGTAVSGSVTYDDATRTATLTPAAALAPSTTYTATVSGAKDASGNVLAAPVSWSFTTEAAPAVTSQTPASGATGVATSTSVTATFNKSVVASSIIFVLKDSAGTTVPATVTYDDPTRTATLKPSAALANGMVYTATISSAQDASGNVQSAPVSWSFTTVAGLIGPISIWPSTAVPVVQADPDTSAVELGLKFRSDLAGQITGIRFYKSTTNTGTHVGNLWSSSGTLLASATFTGETASGWQQVLFSTPVAINANTTYVVSYHTNVGHYSDDDNYFATAGVDNGPLHALKNGVDGANGVYAYGASSNFPNQPSAATNYWVDVVFQTGGGGSGATMSPADVSTSSPSISPLGTSASDGGSFQGDWFLTEAQISNGPLTSALLDAGKTATWGLANWNGNFPSGTSIEVQTRSGKVPTPDETWSDWASVVNGGLVASPAGRYFQYRIWVALPTVPLDGSVLSISFDWM